MEFIVIVHPNQRRSTRLKKQAHAHAARVTHARSRKRQAACHGDQGPNIQVESRGRSVILRQREGEGMSRPQQDVVESQHLVEPSIPSTIPGAFEHEPLASFLKSSTAEERMLFFYCTSGCTSSMPLLKARSREAIGIAKALNTDGRRWSSHCPQHGFAMSYFVLPRRKFRSHTEELAALWLYRY